jgi:hypothetical protein
VCGRTQNADTAGVDLCFDRGSERIEEEVLGRAIYVGGLRLDVLYRFGALNPDRRLSIHRFSGRSAFHRRSGDRRSRFKHGSHPSGLIGTLDFQSGGPEPPVPLRGAGFANEPL